MGRAGNNIASIVFVVALGLFVSQPILNASSDGPPSGGQPEEPVTTTTEAAAEPASTEVSTTTTTAPEPEESPTEAPEEGVAEFLADYPSRCLRVVERPNPGLFAAVQGNQVSISPPGSEVTATIRARAPIQWSPSGRFLGTGGGQVFTAPGDHRGQLFSGPPDIWAWSPTSDCALGVVAGTLQFGTPNDYGALLNGPITDFAVSPNGRKIAIAMDDPDVPGVSLWQGSLATGVLRQTQIFEEEARLLLLGWVGNGIPVAAVADDSAATRLRLVKGAGRVGAVLPFKDQFVGCGRLPHVVLFVQGQRTLQALSPRPFPSPTAEEQVPLAAACAPRGGFIAQIVAGSGPNVRDLLLTDENGAILQDLTQDTGYSDESAWWGPAGTGVAFARRPVAGGSPQIWFIGEGASGTFTGLTTTDLKPVRGHYAWNRVFDWSADVPTGTPTD